MLESKIEKAVCAYAKSLGWLVYKWVSPGNRGVLDRFFIRDGVIIFIEFKALGKKPSKLQQKVIHTLKHNKCKVYVVDSVAKGKSIFDTYEDI
ncbi:VRR-NUC domain-containing protein [Candidatus Dependentiae bacterium]|nr:MAG: VRR-NUC domain-containing protein [Candidatus Dependentiae bacterium]